MTSKKELEQTLFDSLSAAASGRDTQLVDVEVKGQLKRPVVTVFLDAEGGIGLDRLALANAWIGEVFESSAALSGGYTLEVSSPDGRSPRGRGDATT